MYINLIRRHGLIVLFLKFLQLSTLFRCSCNFCRDELLVGALEYRCCHEVLCAIGKATFDGSIEHISCITLHEDYNSMINTAVLTMVGPLLRSSNGHYYKRKSGQNENE